MYNEKGGGVFAADKEMAMVEPLGADAPFFVGVEETVTRTESIRFVTGAMTRASNQRECPDAPTPPT